MQIGLQLLQDKFCICKLDKLSPSDFNNQFFFLAKTDSEISFVCKESQEPKFCKAIDKDWRCIRVAGILDFSLVGILSQISTALANVKIPLYAVSTYHTDYILVKQEHIDNAIDALKRKGYIFI